MYYYPTAKTQGITPIKLIPITKDWATIEDLKKQWSDNRNPRSEKKQMEDSGSESDSNINTAGSKDDKQKKLEYLERAKSLSKSDNLLYLHSTFRILDLIWVFDLTGYENYDNRIGSIQFLEHCSAFGWLLRAVWTNYKAFLEKRKWTTCSTTLFLQKNYITFDPRHQKVSFLSLSWLHPSETMASLLVRRMIGNRSSKILEIAYFSTSTLVSRAFSSSSLIPITTTLLPGDGIGPEIAESLKQVRFL